MSMRIAPIVVLLAALAPLCAEDGPVTSQGEQLITIETSDKPLDVVLQWISRRAGVNIVTNEPDLPKVTIRLVNVTWQEAIDQLARKYDYVIEERSDRIWELTKPPKVRMEFQDAMLRVILDALARQAGTNLVISDNVDGARRLTMKLNGVPWREALDVIVKTTGYVWIEQKYNIIRVMAPGDVQRDLQTRVHRLNYANGQDVRTFLQVALSADGQVEVDRRTNSMIITDSPVNLDAAIEILKQLDQRTEEVQVELKFVEFTTTDAQSIGVQSAGLNFAVDGFGNLTQSMFPFSVDAGRFVRDSEGSPTLSDNKVQTPTSTSLLSGFMTFEALATLATTEVIQAPTLLTLNNEQASINLTNEIRFAEETVSNENGQLIRTAREAESSPVSSGIQIELTPHITSDGFVSLELNASDSTNQFRTFSFGNSSIDLPQLSRKQVETTIMVADGETAVIGGLLFNQVDENETRVPLLGSIPLLGYLFRNTSDTIVQRNLSIFITPRIVQLAEKDDLEASKIRLREQLSGLDLTPEEDGDTAGP